MPVESAVVAVNMYPFFSVLNHGSVMVCTKNVAEREMLLDLLTLYEVPLYDEAAQASEERAYEITADGMIGARMGDLANIEENLLISPGELKSRLMEIQLAEDENIL